MLIPDRYYKLEKEVKLTQADIDAIVECLEREEHGIFVLLNYLKIIDKLKVKDEQKKDDTSKGL